MFSQTSKILSNVFDFTHKLVPLPVDIEIFFQLVWGVGAIGVRDVGGL